MAHEKLVLCAVAGLTLVAAWGFGCASIIGADDYKVAGGGAAGAGGATGTAGATVATTGAAGNSTTTTATGAGGASGAAGRGGAGGSATCSAATPDGQRMCGPGRTCNTDSCGPPLTYACFAAGSVTEGNSCTTKTDCAVGLTCIHYNARYACRTLCSANTDCPVGYLCAESFSCGNNPDTAGNYCSKPCSDVVTAAGSAGCAAGFRCNFLCDPDTQTPLPPSCDFEAGPLRSGSCASDDDCAAGYFCLDINVNGLSVCTQACRSDADCMSGTCTGTIFCRQTPTTYSYCR